MLKEKNCEHLEGFQKSFEPKGYECEECVKTGDRWVHLRTCQECGMTLCCDSSPNKHATQHFHDHGHRVVTSAEPGEFWAWCYEHQEIKMLTKMKR